MAASVRERQTARNLRGELQSDVPGVFGTSLPPGPIALDTPAPSAKPSPPPPPPPAAIELSLVGSFPNPWQGTPAKEKELAAASTWFPSTPDFKAVAGTGSVEVASAWAFVLQIINAGKSIRRLNFFSHGITSLISFAGTIDPKGQNVTFSSSPDDGWSQVLFRNAIVDPYAKKWGDAGENSSTKITLNTTSFSLDDIRAKFAPEAVIWLYLCHGASDPRLFQEVANTFQVTVKGFDKVIVYCVPANFPTNRKHKLATQTTTKPEDSCANAVDDFHKLDGSTNVRTATPQKP